MRGKRKHNRRDFRIRPPLATLISKAYFFVAITVHQFLCAVTIETVGKFAKPERKHLRTSFKKMRVKFIRKRRAPSTAQCDTSCVVYHPSHIQYKGQTFLSSIYRMRVHSAFSSTDRAVEKVNAYGTSRLMRSRSLQYIQSTFPGNVKLMIRVIEMDLLKSDRSVNNSAAVAGNSTNSSREMLN